jgi:nitroreductase
VNAERFLEHNSVVPGKFAHNATVPFLGMMSLGCVMENMWLTAETLGVGVQIMSVFSSKHVGAELRKILSIPNYIDIASACRLGYPPVEPGRYLRVRREIQCFTNHNRYAAHGEE